MEFNFQAPDGAVFLKYSHLAKVTKDDGTGLYKINERKNKAVKAEVHSVGLNVEGVQPGDTIVCELASIWEVSDGIFCIKEEDILAKQDLLDQLRQTISQQ